MGKSGQKTNPKTVAETILSKLESSDLIEKVIFSFKMVNNFISFSFKWHFCYIQLEIAGPGFINIHLKKDKISSLTGDILLHGVIPPPIDKKRAVVDFSAPNIAKEMHVGHLRWILKEFLGIEWNGKCHFLA